MTQYIQQSAPGPRPPTERQVKFAGAIADALGIELPEKKTRQSLFLFIRDHRPQFEEKRSVDRHNARVYAMAYESENPDNDPDNDETLMDAFGLDPWTGGFADNY